MSEMAKGNGEFRSERYNHDVKCPMHHAIIVPSPYKTFAGGLLLLSIPFAAMITTGSLYGKKRPDKSEKPQALNLEWRPVRGSRGYVLEYRREGDSRVFKKYLRSNRVHLILKTGFYELRLAGRNKFGRPGAWTDWHPFEIKRRRKKERVTLQQLKREARVRQKKIQAEKIEKIAKQKRERERALESRPSWWRRSMIAAVPGLPQIRRGDRFRGMLYMSAFGGVALYAFLQQRAANAEADKATSDPVFLTFMIFNQRRTPSLEGGTGIIDLRDESRRVYDIRRRRHLRAVKIMGAIYALHWIDHLLFSGEPRSWARRSRDTDGSFGSRYGGSSRFRAAILPAGKGKAVGYFRYSLSY